MYRRGDPRWNRTIQHLASNIETANETAQEGLFTFTQSYINPCLSSIGSCFEQCTAPCFGSREVRMRRSRARTRGRAELSFDFYDDWEYEDENNGLLDWGNDEFDRLLQGSSSQQPGRNRAMSYGTRHNRDSRFPNGRRKSAVKPHDGGPDPTIIPSSSYFGFLGRLPFRLGGKTLRYKPSAADLTEHPGASRRHEVEEQPLIEDTDEETHERFEGKGHRRNRSHTSTSGHTTDSLSSRGDIFPSEDELDDAVPLDDEFAMALERRATSLGPDDGSSGRTRPSSRRKGLSRMSTRTVSSRSTKSKPTESDVEELPSLSDLKEEEERLRIEEETHIERKRSDAQQLARKRGLSTDQPPTLATLQSPAAENSMLSPRSPSPIPFPAFDNPQTAPESGAFTVDDSDLSSAAPTPDRPSSLKDEERETQALPDFVPARLPHFGQRPD